jgi:hypothetical protein
MYHERLRRAGRAADFFSGETRTARWRIPLLRNTAGFATQAVFRAWRLTPSDHNASGKKV